MGYSFPKEYKKVISKYDELIPVDNIFDFTNIYGEVDERDLNFISFNTDEATSIYDYRIISNPEYAGIPHLVAFAVCANGDYICFDYRENPNGDNPKVVLVYHDDFVENEDGTSSMVVNFVADNFEEFMARLHE
ncbi:SMI1/KNR4 family protein [Psychrobacter lutiphocae]|uniref:SMI1/KNR4 family protein n=1 Tax=Psychrobacter lutiphocae TaxID=540500 RepID=UPI000A00A881|nr:SMI1/KNR4 family protein [Psychrobacter lutiphocae]